MIRFSLSYVEIVTLFTGSITATRFPDESYTKRVAAWLATGFAVSFAVPVSFNFYELLKNGWTLWTVGLDNKKSALPTIWGD